MFKKFFETKKTMLKAPAGFELITYRFLVTALTHWATLFDNNFEEENILI